MVSQTYVPQEGDDYLASLKDLLNCYEGGWDILKNAKQWDTPITIKEEARYKIGLPLSWLELADRVINIIAVEKYGLDCYPNLIEIITAEQMLDAYASVGMPVSYEHWSFGKQRILEEKDYKQGKRGLAYEIVINTDPAIAYCMEGNSPLMQMLVIAHASYGHNSFFKGNHLFQQFTDAGNIIDELRFMRDFIAECEEKYGTDEVESLLDACHALRAYAVDRYVKPPEKTQAEKEALEKAKLEARFNKPSDSKIWDKVTVRQDFEASVENANAISGKGEQNIVKYIADTAPHLPEWKRHIMRMFAEKQQYFYPQGQTQVMNEGWASLWHYTLLNDMAELNLLSDGQMLEFMDSHAGVLFQPDYDSPYYSGRMNPYTLGFAIYNDIKRICLEPTEEDREWFPHFAGNPDWLSVLKEAMHNFKDESFILQYLSPKLIRDFKFFALKDDAEEDTYEIQAIHNRGGYQRVREVLASNYQRSDIEPQLSVYEYYYRTDRTLVLHHEMYQGKPLDERDTQDVLRHVHALWGHRVILKSVNPDGSVVKRYACPEKPVVANDTDLTP